MYNEEIADLEKIIELFNKIEKSLRQKGDIRFCIYGNSVKDSIPNLIKGLQWEMEHNIKNK